MFDWVVSTIEGWGYLGVLMLMVAENVFPPIPSEVIMPLAGFLAGSGRLSLTLTIVVGTIGSVLGTLMWYYIGLWFGEERLKRFAARHGRLLTLSPSDIDAAHEWFQRHGAMAVFFGRMIPAIRTLISVPAGLARMPMWKFLLYTVIGSALWTGVLTFAGLMLHENYALVADYVDPLSKLVVIAVVAIYLYRVVTWKPH
ncbi:MULTISPECIES: DedA family protein [Paracoccus]|jgi:membrane protein DedA with SNARE-associated domain|uniref:DedA family protein n=1 Tax=Paracoccus denitrificans (strain Pd 1222) TaxID=318586 RepID=A1B8T9_PARDP|nr:MULTISPECIES: DedA family protein [Paracoccus]ABL71933.1 DedA family protein [Paracoccus denitrificans PD1222]MBB4626164.1 membrane protein DedA with SNARE-associated domain [Paracoccus denitrificans]MCU7430612.1 DedA family protein [Paracoccus denitrificans]QAR28514.1 DedA family protein [Paracoccus denitrificans]UFS66288.1 DedA family protein [Paracoccus denitrificans]